MSICRPGVESGISTCLTSSQVLPGQLVYRVIRGADKFPGIAGTTGLQSGQGGRWFLQQKHPQ